MILTLLQPCPPPAMLRGLRVVTQMLRWLLARCPCPKVLRALYAALGLSPAVFPLWWILGCFYQPNGLDTLLWTPLCSTNQRNLFRQLKSFRVRAAVLTRFPNSTCRRPVRCIYVCPSPSYKSASSFSLRLCARSVPTVHYRVRRRLRAHVNVMNAAGDRLPRTSPLHAFRPGIRIAKGLRFASSRAERRTTLPAVAGRPPARCPYLLQATNLPRPTCLTLRQARRGTSCDRAGPEPGCPAAPGASPPRSPFSRCDLARSAALRHSLPHRAFGPRSSSRPLFRVLLAFYCSTNEVQTRCMRTKFL